ncbi:MAG: hypothetical protein L0Z62_22610 [Gemmataceae bacterium]|nr:hypothetical protein [Gemmataceae bacterium]
MSRVEIPIQYRTLYATGDILLKAEVDLHLKDQAGGFHRRTFLIDSGTEITTFAAFDAKGLGLALPAAASPGVTHSSGLEVRSGILPFRIEGMDPADIYAVVCFFLGDPGVAPTTGATFPRNLLQPFQLLERLKFTAEKDPGAGPLFGKLVIEKR